MDRETSFVFYRSFKDAIDNCSVDDKLMIYESIVNYALDGTLPEITGGTIKIIWPLIEPQLSANRFKRKAGRKGGAPRKTIGLGGEMIKGYTIGKTIGLHVPQPNVNENENVNDNEEHKVITSFDQIPR